MEVYGLPFIVKNCLLMEKCIYGFLRILVWVIFYGWYMQIIENSVVKVHMEIFLWDFRKIGFFVIVFKLYLFYYGVGLMYYSGTRDKLCVHIHTHYSLLSMNISKKLNFY